MPLFQETHPHLSLDLHFFDECDHQEAHNIEYDVLNTAFGDCLLAFYQHKICYMALVMSAHKEKEALNRLAKLWPACVISRQQNSEVFTGCIEAIFSDQPSTLSLIIRGSECQKNVWQAILSIASNEQITLQELQLRCKGIKSSQQLAEIVDLTPIAVLIPHHRVLANQQVLGSFQASALLKRQLLKAEEQVEIKPHKVLYLHCGFGKTGSSALQSWLAINQDVFAEQGITYAGANTAAKKLQINSGNAWQLLDYLQQDIGSEEELIDYYFAGMDRAIISSEILQRLERPQLQKLQQWSERHSIQIEMIAYVRNAYDMLYSGFVQAVKRKNYTESFSTRFANIKNYHQLMLVERFSSYFPLSFIHYDQHRDNIAEPFCQLLAVDYQAFTALEKIPVNRSLNADEIAILQYFMKPLEQQSLLEENFSMIVSDELVNQFPLTSSVIPLYPSVYENFNKTFSDSIERFNRNQGVAFNIELHILSDRDYENPQAIKKLDKKTLRRMVKIIISNKQRFKKPVLICLAKSLISTDIYSAVNIFQAVRGHCFKQ